jgi:predicted MFS family arabinose efflux permease
MIPVFNIFLPILAIRLGANALQVGLVGGTSNAVYALMPLVVGRFSNSRRSRRFFVLSSFSILTTISLLYSIATSPITLIFLRIFEGTAWSMFWPTLEAEITVSGMRDQRKSLSLYNVVWSGASALGPLIGSLATLLLSLRSAFLVTAVILFWTLALNLIRRGKPSSADEIIRIDDDRTPPAHVSSSSYFSQENRGNSRKVQHDRFVLYLVLASNALIGVSFSVLITFFGPYAQSVGISITTIGAVTFAYGSLRFFFFYLSTRDDFRGMILHGGRMIGVVLITTAICCLATLLFLINGSTILLSIMVFSLVGISQTFVVLISQVVTIAEARIDRKGTRAGLLESTTGMGASLGPIVGGALSSHSLVYSFTVPGISFIGIMALLASYRILRRRRRTEG